MPTPKELAAWHDAGRPDGNYDTWKKKQDSNAAGGTSTPAGGGTSTPASGSGTSTPASGSGTSTPAGGGTSTPASGSGTSTPASGSGTSTPAGGGTSTPASGSGTSTPAGGGTSTSASGGTSTPASGSGTGTPAAGGTGTPPAAGTGTPPAGGTNPPAGAAAGTNPPAGTAAPGTTPPAGTAAPAGPGPNKHDDWVPILSDLLGLLLSITETVYSCIEQGMDLAGTLTKKTRDDINISALIVDNSLITIVTVILCVIETVNSAKIEIGANGDITLESESQSQIYVSQAVQVGSPTSSIAKNVYRMRIAGKIIEIAQLSAGYGMEIHALRTQDDGEEEETL